jgi:hypothetical protein
MAISFVAGDKPSTWTNLLSTVMESTGSPRLRAPTAKYLIATEQVARMMTAILKDFIGRLDYDSRCKAERLKLDRRRIRRAERMCQ